MVCSLHVPWPPSYSAVPGMNRYGSSWLVLLTRNLAKTPLRRERCITVHFIMLCETFLLDVNADRFNIPGYCFVHKSRKYISRGGVALYTSNEFHFKLRPDLCINIEGEFECIAAEIEAKRGNVISLLQKYIEFLIHQKGNLL